MKKLELKHLAPYLPFGLKMRVPVNGFKKSYHRTSSVSIKQVDWLLASNRNKLILRPLSDLKKEIQIAEYFCSFRGHLRIQFPSESIGLNPATWSYRVVEKLFEWHFDVFGLIGKGLAIDINTLK